MPRYIAVLTTLLFLFGSGHARAQEACPPPSLDMDMLKERMLRLADRDQASGIAGLVSIAVAPGTVTPACPS